MDAACESSSRPRKGIHRAHHVPPAHDTLDNPEVPLPYRADSETARGVGRGSRLFAHRVYTEKGVLDHVRIGGRGLSLEVRQNRRSPADHARALPLPERRAEVREGNVKRFGNATRLGLGNAAGIK